MKTPIHHDQRICHSSSRGRLLLGGTRWVPFGRKPCLSDAIAFDGTASLVQPLVAPLYDTRTLHALRAATDPGAGQPDLQRVQDTWRQAAGSDPAAWWRTLPEPD